jgi:hypothetical protein
LNEKGKGKTGEVKNLYGLNFDSPKGPEKKEDNPEKMNQNNDICKDLVEHLSNRPLIINQYPIISLNCFQGEA